MLGRSEEIDLCVVGQPRELVPRLRLRKCPHLPKCACAALPAARVRRSTFSPCGRRAMQINNGFLRSLLSGGTCRFTPSLLKQQARAHLLSVLLQVNLLTFAGGAQRVEPLGPSGRRYWADVHAAVVIPSASQDLVVCFQVPGQPKKCCATLRSPIGSRVHSFLAVHFSRHRVDS